MEGLFSLRRRASRQRPRGQPPVALDKDAGNGNGSHGSDRENGGNLSSGMRRRVSSASSLIPPPFELTDLGTRENREVRVFCHWIRVRN